MERHEYDSEQTTARDGKGGGERWCWYLLQRAFQPVLWCRPGCMTTVVDDWASMGMYELRCERGRGVELAYDGASAYAPDALLACLLPCLYFAVVLQDGIVRYWDFSFAFAPPFWTGICVGAANVRDGISPSSSCRHEVLCG